MIPQTPAAGATVTSAILSDGDEAAQIEEAGWGWRYNRWGWRRVAGAGGGAGAEAGAAGADAGIGGTAAGKSRL